MFGWLALIAHMDKAGMESVPFCERNVKGWIIVLSTVAVGVLVLTVTMAATGQGNLGFDRARRMWQSAPPKATPLVSTPALPPPALPAPPQPAVPAIAVNFVAPPNSPQFYAPAPNAGTPNVDLVARASPGGGILFVGGAGIQGGGGNPGFQRAATAIRPAVVSISAAAPAYAPAPPPVAAGAQFQAPFDGVPDTMVGQSAYESVGSGVIIDPAGFVVTNNHVIAGASNVLVSLASQPDVFLPTKTILASAASDLALLQITSGGTFPSARLGDSSQMRVGDWVLAVGYPFGLELTVTAGIVGGRHVDLAIAGRPFLGLLQTDAPINKGSSGGPLVDLNGQIIGINTAIYAPTGVFSGAGFAIPSNRVGAFVARGMETAGVTPADELPAIVATPTALTPPTAATTPAPAAAPPAQQPALASPAVWLGIGLVDVSADMARQLAFPFSGGAFVASVILDSPAEEAEILRGDVLVSMASQPVTGVDTISRLVAGMAPGQAVPITIWRSGKTTNTTIRLRGGG